MKIGGIAGNELQGDSRVGGFGVREGLTPVNMSQ